MELKPTDDYDDLFTDDLLINILMQEDDEDEDEDNDYEN